MATVTDLRPILPEYETLYRVNQQLKEEKQAYKRLSKEHLWEVFKTALWGLASLACAAGMFAACIILAHRVVVSDAAIFGTAFAGAISGIGSLLLAVSFFCCSPGDFKIGLKTKQETIARLQAESQQIEHKIKTLKY